MKCKKMSLILASAMIVSTLSCSVMASDFSQGLQFVVEYANSKKYDGLGCATNYLCKLKDAIEIANIKNTLREDLKVLNASHRFIMEACRSCRSYADGHVFDVVERICGQVFNITNEEAKVLVQKIKDAYKVRRNEKDCSNLHLSMLINCSDRGRAPFTHNLKNNPLSKKMEEAVSRIKAGYGDI